MSVSEKGHVDSVMIEQRVFPPSADFASRARIKSLAEYEQLYAKAGDDLEAFWASEAREHLHWFTPFHTTLQWNERMRSGSSAAKPMQVTTAWTLRLRPDMATEQRSFGKVNQVTLGRLLTSNCTKKFVVLPTFSKRTASSKATW